MITAQMREYNFFLYSGTEDAYGQRTLIKDADGEPIGQGTVKLAINNTSTTIQDNIRYKDATYVGLTHDVRVDDSFVIQYEDERLKVLYVNPNGRYRQVFMSNI